MTKNFYNFNYRSSSKYELLSAYLDNELSEEDVKKIEEELKFSKELQEKLAELKAVKQLTVSSVSRIPENPYFDTRLAASMKIKNPWYHNLKRYSPVYSLVALCVILMVVLRYNPQIIDKLLDQQKSNITAFYKDNLKPLLYTANLTNEDIFDFAFNHRLPLDSQKKQYLMLGSDTHGKPYFEIKDAGIAHSGNNLAAFVKNLNLTGHQQHQMDSILASYAGDMQKQVLVNDKNTVAINPNIWNVNKAIAMDLIAFAQKINKKETQKIVPPGYNQIASSNAMHQMARELKSAKNNKYIFFTSDSIFSDHYQFDENKFNNEMAKWSAEVSNNFRQMGKQFNDFNYNFHFGENIARNKNGHSRNKGFNVYIDSNVCRVDIPEIDIPQMFIPEMGNLGEKIDSLTKYFSHFSFPNPGKGKNYSYNYLYTDSGKGYNFNYKAYGFDSSFVSGNPKMDKAMKRRFKNFGFNPDSIFSMFRMFGADSANGHGQREIQRQLRIFKRQMQQFQKQMEQMQKQLPKGDSTEPPDRPVEI